MDARNGTATPAFNCVIGNRFGCYIVRMVKEAAEAIGNILGNVSLLLVVTIGCALLLYFPPHLVPDGAQATVAQYRGWIWGAMILGGTGLLVRITTFLTTKIAGWSRSVGTRMARNRMLFDLGASILTASRDEKAVLVAFASTDFATLAFEAEHPLVRRWVRAGILEPERRGRFWKRISQFMEYEVTDLGREAVAMNAEALFAEVSAEDAVRLCNPIMENPLRLYREGQWVRPEWQ